MDNGISLAESPPSGAATVEVAAAAQPLHTAASVSLNELTDIPWNGNLRSTERLLVKALKITERAAAAVPGPGYRGTLDASVIRTSAALKTLNHQVSIEG
jgi:hypothetical protein